MEQARSFFQNLFSPSPSPSETPPDLPPRPSYRGTGAVAARRPTIQGGRSGLAAGYYRSPSESIVVHRGLRNKSGENNCFLNAAVQVLWHTDVFRRSFRLCEGHTCVGEKCIFCSLKVIFTQYQHAQQSSIPPDILRNAMADCYKDQERFQLGLMDDAAECFEKLLEQMHFHLTGTSELDSCSCDWCIPHVKFALTTVEQMACGCGQSSEPHTFVEFVHYVATSVIKTSHEEFVREGCTPHDVIFDKVIHTAGVLDQWRPCQNVKCTGQVQLKRLLLNSPDVMCIGLIWDSDCPSVDYIMGVLNSIGLKIHPQMIFDSVVSNRVRAGEYFLTAMITYYGRHYSTFCYHSRQESWIYFDDARFRKIGSDWSDVKEECRAAHYQPLLLVYSNPKSTTVDTTNAPKTVTKHCDMKATPTTDTSPKTTPTDVPKTTPTSDTSQKTTPTEVTPALPPKTTPTNQEIPDLMQFSVTPSALSRLATPSQTTPPQTTPLPINTINNMAIITPPTSKVSSSVAYTNNAPPTKNYPSLYPQLTSYSNTPLNTTGYITVNTVNTASTNNTAINTGSNYTTSNTTADKGYYMNVGASAHSKPKRPQSSYEPLSSSSSFSSTNPFIDNPVPPLPPRAVPPPLRAVPPSQAVTSPRTADTPTNNRLISTPSSSREETPVISSDKHQFEKDFERYPRDVRLSLLTAGACLDQLSQLKTDNLLIQLSLTDQAIFQLSSVLDSSCQMGTGIRNSLSFKKQELERKSRLIKQQKINYPNMKKLSQLLLPTTVSSTVTDVTQSSDNKVPLVRKSSPVKPPIAKKPSLENLSDNKGTSQVTGRTPSPVSGRGISPGRTPSPVSGRGISPRRTPSPVSGHCISPGRSPSPEKTILKCSKCLNLRKVNTMGLCDPCQMRLRIS